MRISTQVLYQRSVNSVLGQQSTLSQQNQYLSSTKRVLSGADDPVAIATIQRLNQDISVGEQYLKNADVAEAANALEDTALTQVTNVLQRVRELVVTSGNDTYNDKNRDVIASELEELLEELVGAANTKDANSQYIFSGFEVDTQPYQFNEFGEVEFHGDTGTSHYRVGSGVSVQGYDSGASIFSGIEEGNGTFVSEVNANNSGSGVIAEGTVTDESVASDFADQDYTIAINTPAGGTPEYSVYGLASSAVNGNANVKISQVDLSDPNIATVNPSAPYPEPGSDVSIKFIATADPEQFEVQINDQPTLPATIYDSSNTNTQTLNINGISIEVDGVPSASDQYTMTKYTEPTLYEEGEPITFNGINTEIMGEVANLDSFSLRQSGEKDIFTSIQDSIDALRIPGDDDASKAQRSVAIENALLEIDNGMNNVSYMHTTVGTRLNTIDSQRETTLDCNLTNQSSLSNLEDLDMAGAISEFQLQSSMLEISQQTFIQLQSLSLFKLI